MSTAAAQALPVLALFIPACTPPTFLRLQLLAVAAVLTTGRRTVSNLLRTLGHRAAGAPSSYHRVLSEARWSGLRMAALLTRFLLASGTGHWYRGGAGLVPLRWVFAHDLSGARRDEYFYTTELAATPPEVVERYVGRWNIETTFAEMRSYLGPETTRGRCARTVLRAEPCLFGLYSVVALWYERLPAEVQAGAGWTGRARRR